MSALDIVLVFLCGAVCAEFHEYTRRLSKRKGL